jgi:hypothetical protein
MPQDMNESSYQILRERMQSQEAQAELKMRAKK